MKSKPQTDAIYLYCNECCKREYDSPTRHDVGDKWDENYYSWEVIPLSHVNTCSALDADIAKYADKFNGILNREAFQRFAESMRIIHEQAAETDADFKTWLTRAKSTGDFLRLCVQIGSLSRVLDTAISRKLEVEHTKRVEDVMYAVRKVSGNVVDLDALRRGPPGKGNDRVKQGA